MSLVESLRIAFRALAANKLRAALTMLGIVIGVTAVITLMSLGRGAQQTITNQIESMGSNLLFVSPGRTNTGGVRGATGSIATLTLEDAEALADSFNAPSIAAVAPELQTFLQVVGAGQNLNTRVVGVTETYESVRNLRVAEGNFVTKESVDAKSRIAILGANVADTLFGGQEAIGQSVKINRVEFKVEGVLEKKGGTGMGSQDDVIYVPITAMQARLFAQRTAGGGRNVSSINIQVVNADELPDAIDQVSTILRQRHRLSGEDDFTVLSQAETLAAMGQITGILTLFLGSIAGISLLVGGIGIMNIMLVSVTERTREIGIRKAVGAKRQHILIQFLIESGVLSLTGGGTGVLLGWIITLLFNMVNMEGISLPKLVVSPDAVILAVSVSAAIGLFFGIYPATRAAKLNPIEALRYE